MFRNILNYARSEAKKCFKFLTLFILKVTLFIAFIGIFVNYPYILTYILESYPILRLFIALAIILKTSKSLLFKISVLSIVYVLHCNGLLLME